MNSSEILSELERIGAILQDSHVIYTSGRHGKSYVNKDAIYPHTGLTRALCLEMAKAWKDEGIETVLAPALGGIILSQWVAYHLTEMGGEEVLGVYAEKSPAGDAFLIRRGYDKLIRGKRTLILEDILTTGGSVKKVVETAREIGADIRGVSALCNRGGITPVDIGGVPKLISLVQLSLDSWEAAECPLCAAKVPLNTSVGKARAS